MHVMEEVLRLRYECGRLQREIACASGLLAGEVNQVRRRAGVDWPLSAHLDGEKLKERRYGSPAGARRAVPDFVETHKQLSPPKSLPVRQLWRGTGRRSRSVTGTASLGSIAGVGGEAVTGDAAGAPSGRKAVRRLRRADGTGAGCRERAGVRVCTVTPTRDGSRTRRTCSDRTYGWWIISGAARNCWFWIMFPGT